MEVSGLCQLKLVIHRRGVPGHDRASVVAGDSIRGSTVGSKLSGGKASVTNESSTYR